MSHDPDDISWQEYAACRGKGTDVFYPSNYSDSNVALRYCCHCVVRTSCLEYALNKERYLPKYLYFGVWGGMVSSERKKLNALRSRQTLDLAAKAG